MVNQQFNEQLIKKYVETLTLTLNFDIQTNSNPA